MNMTKSKRILYRMVAVGFMAALVYVGNYIQIKIPNGVLITRIHLGNSMCLLAGLLFGGVSGGLASGIGAMLYDLFDPVYIISAPYTFLSKFAMGFTCGALKRREANEKLAVVIAAVVGQVVYITLYLLKSYFTVLIIGGTQEAAWLAVGNNAITSSVNAVLAVIIAVPLYFALNRALKATPIFNVLNNKSETPKEKLFNPLTISLTVFAVICTLYFTINLSASGKMKNAELEKENALTERISVLEEKVDRLYTLISE